MIYAYYNENDPFAAEWLRVLIRKGLICNGVVDERSIEDVAPSDLKDFTQCHFFAGIGVWSYALRLAGWPDDRAVWSGSCPCQPFSSAGRGCGFDDPRHLWPHFFWLIQQCRPDVVFGEQVAGKAGEAWLDLVSTDLEAKDYTCGACVTAACGFGAPHIRKRLYWVAHANEVDPGLARGARGAQGQGVQSGAVSDGRGMSGGLAHSSSKGLEGSVPARQREPDQQPAPERSGALGGPGATNGHWRDVDWLGCRDDRWRPVEPGSFPLAHGAPARVGRLRGYGNALVAQQAQAFIEAYHEVKGGLCA